MIYCTFCIGEDWCKKYSKSVNLLAKNHNVHILTDNPKYFENCKVIKYERDVFSYYEKLPFSIRLSIENKKRVVFFDVDSISNFYFQSILKKEYELDDISVYSLDIYNPKELNLENESYMELMDIYRSYSYYLFPNYLHERIFSLPYIKGQTEEILKQVLDMQSVFEEKYHKDRIWTKGHRNQKWSDVGCGYGEGGALSIIVHNMKLPLKKLIIKNNLF